MGWRDKFKKKKIVDQDKSHKRTEFSIQGKTHRIAVEHEVGFHQREAQPELSPSPAARGRSTSSRPTDQSGPIKRDRSSSSERQVANNAGENNQSHGWNPYIAGAAVGLGAFCAPVLAVGVVTATGYAVAAAGATMVANHISDNNRRIRESEHNVVRAAIKADRDVRKHEAAVGAQKEVFLRMVESGQSVGGNLHGNSYGRGNLTGVDRRMIEYLSDSD